MSNPGKPPVHLTSDKMQLLVDHINMNFNNHDEDGNLDLDRCQNNVAYNIGHIYSNYNGLLMQERMKLADIKADLAIVRESAYHDIKMTRAQYDIDSTGMKLKIDGSPTVAPKQREFEKQEAYVKFLETLMRQISTYAAGVKTILYREEIKYRYNQ
jgi:hypothetical protein